MPPNGSDINSKGFEKRVLSAVEKLIGSTENREVLGPLLFICNGSDINSKGFEKRVLSAVEKLIGSTENREVLGPLLFICGVVRSVC
jgi:hypothetical protein